LRVATRHDVACSAMLAASPLQHLPDGKAQFLRRTFSRANDAFVASPISSSDRANVSASNATCSSINSCKHFNGTDTAMTKTACVSQAESRALVYGCMPHVACIRYLRCMRQIAWCVLRLCPHIPSHGTAQSHPARLVPYSAVCWQYSVGVVRSSQRGSEYRAFASVPSRHDSACSDVHAVTRMHGRPGSTPRTANALEQRMPSQRSGRLVLPCGRVTPDPTRSARI
jgi:hypothetical protein